MPGRQRPLLRYVILEQPITFTLFSHNLGVVYTVVQHTLVSIVLGNKIAGSWNETGAGYRMSHRVSPLARPLGRRKQVRVRWDGGRGAREGGELKREGLNGSAVELNFRFFLVPSFLSLP